MRDNPILNYLAVTPGYFEAMRIGLVRGRLFDARDGKQAVSATWTWQPGAYRVVRDVPTLGAPRG